MKNDGEGEAGNRAGAGRGYETPPKVSLNEFECRRKTISSLVMMMKTHSGVLLRRGTLERKC